MRKKTVRIFVAVGGLAIAVSPSSAPFAHADVGAASSPTLRVPAADFLVALVAAAMSS
jgi:hypothetical protein